MTRGNTEGSGKLPALCPHRPIDPSFLCRECDRALRREVRRRLRTMLADERVSPS